MLNRLSKYISSNPIGRIFNLGKKTVAWKKITDLKPGMKIAIAPSSSLRGVSDVAIQKYPFGIPPYKGGRADTGSPRAGQRPPFGARDDTVDFDEIISIRPIGQEQVYDIEVENTHNFVGNGILAHNTLIAGNVTPSTTSTYDIGSSSLYWNNLYVNTINAPATGVSGYWQRNSGAIAPANLTDDLLLGTTATSSALIAFKNIASGTPTASISGNSAGRALVIDGLGNITTTAKQSLTLGDASTGNIILNAGNVGIGTTAPLQTLHIAGQCVTGDTLLRRRRKKSKVKSKKSKVAGGWDPEDDYYWEDVRIDQIAEGDEILTLDEKTGRFITSKVNGLMEMGIQETYLLITESGKQIRTTSEHPYLVRKSDQATIVGGVYQVDQSSRIENLSKDSYIALANKNLNFVIKISKEYKKSVYKQYQSQNKLRFFAPDLFAKAINTILISQQISPARLEIDHEYSGSESRITQTIKLAKPHLDIKYQSIGHSSSSWAHWAAYQTFKGKIKPTLIVTENKKDRGAIKVVGLGAVTLIPLNQIRNTRDLLQAQEYPKTSDLSRNTKWIKVHSLSPGMQIAVAPSSSLRESSPSLRGVPDVAIQKYPFGIPPYKGGRADTGSPRAGQRPPFGARDDAVAWETIVVLKKYAREQVYDIEVENTHNFVGNGIVAHNTYINSTANSASIKGLEIAQSGAVTGTGYGLYAAKTGASTTNVGGYFSASGATNNYGLIVGNGNVGIGTTGPLGNLHVVGASASLLRLASNETDDTVKWVRMIASQYDSGTETEGYTLLRGSTDATSNIVAIGGSFDENNAATEVRIYTAPNVTTRTGTQQVTINSSGNVGIGRTSPSTTLDVAGSATISATLSLAPYTQGAAGTCNAAAAGKMYYDGTGGSYYYCNGTSWTQIGAGAAVQYFDQQNGLLYPMNSTVDFSIGGQSTASAKFVIKNILTGTPTASISGNSAGRALVIDGLGNITTTVKQSLTLGDSSTGNIILNAGNVGIGNTSPQYKLDVTGSINASTGNAYYINGTSVLNATTLGTGVLTSSLTTVGALASGSIASGFGTITTANTITGTVINGTTGINTGAGAGTQRIDVSGNLANIGTTQFNSITYTWPGTQGSNYVLTTNGSGTLTWNDVSSLGASTDFWNQNNGLLFPKNSTVDFSLGGQATSSAKFAVLNLNTGTPTATISGNSAGRALSIDGLGNITTTAMSPITIGSASTGTIQLSPKGTTGLFVDGSGNVGVGTITPTSFGAGYTIVDARNSTSGVFLWGDSAGVATGQLYGVGGVVTIGSRNNVPVNFTINNTEKMRLDVDGDLGINNTNPLYKLDVTGTASVSADMLIGGQTQLGRFGTNPGGIGKGGLIYNTATDKVYYYNGTTWTQLADSGGSNPWTDGGTYVYPTAYESIRAYDAGGTDYMDLSHDGTNAIFTSVNTTKYTFDKWIDITGALTTSGNIDINGTSNDIAGTLNLSGNTLTSASNLTINAGGTKTIISDDLQISGGDILGESGNIRITVVDALQRTDVTGLLSADRGATFSAAIAADTPLTLNNNAGALIYKVSNAGLITSGVTDSSTAIAFNLDTANSISTYGSKLLSLKNYGTEKFSIDKDGNLYVAGTVTSSKGLSALLTNKSGAQVAVGDLVVVDTTTASSFTTTTVAHNKKAFGVIVGIGLGVTNDADGDGVCDANDICLVATQGKVTVTGSNTTVIGDYLYSSTTAGKALASSVQSDGLIGIAMSADASDPYSVEMMFVVQPSGGGGGFFSNSNASVADGSYVEVAHNQATNDLNTTGWQYNTTTSQYEQIDTNGSEQATASATVNFNTEGNYTQENMAYAVTLTPSATSGDITLTLGSGNWNSDARVQQYCRVTGNGGVATLTAAPAAQTTITATTTTAFANTNAIASGSWYLYCTNYVSGTARLNPGPGFDVGTFATTSQAQLPQPLGGEGYIINASVGGTNYLYAIGGYNGGSLSTVYKAAIDNSTGNVGTWATTSQSQLPAVRIDTGAISIAVGGTNYVYVIGGSASSTVYKTTIDSSANIGAFSTTSQAQLPAARSGLPLPVEYATIGGTSYIYVIGGDGPVSTVYKATIDGSQNVGTFATTSQGQLLVSLNDHNTALLTIGGTNYLYVLGGYNGAAYISTVYKATIDSSGNVGTFATTSQAQLPAIRGRLGVASVSSDGGYNYVYAIGGTSGVYNSTVYRSMVDGSGNVGTFSTTNQGQFPITHGLVSANIVNVGGTNYLYAISGSNSGSAVYRATIGPDNNPITTVYSVVTAGDQISTSSWGDIDDVDVTETLNSQTIYYSVSFDGRTTFAMYDATTNNTGWRPIARNNSGTWQYNSNTTAGVSNVTWTNATYNSQNGALSQAFGVTNNQMSGTSLAGLTDGNWNEINGYISTTATLDFAAGFKSSSATQNPQVDQINVDYTKAGFKIIQTDTNTARLYNYSGVTKNLRLDVTTNGGAVHSGLYTNANSALANGSYVEVAHNQNTNNLLANGWVYQNSQWKDVATATESGIISASNASVADGSYVEVVHNQQTSDVLASGWKYNSSTSQWEKIDNGSAGTGGTITYSGGYTIHTFTSSGTFTPPGSGNVEYLVVGGGGGGGGSYYAGGGGAGGYLTATGFAVTAQAYTITVGAGGAGGTNGTPTGTKGSNSVFSSITAEGGGLGSGTAGGGGNGGNGGSGGGASSPGTTGGTATSGQGSNGGGTSASQAGGSGGGKGAVGVAGTNSAGAAGGAGSASSISGSSVTYAGGGGGGVGFVDVVGAGGSGGGGAGGGNTIAAVAGTANTGGGGGGAGYGGGSAAIGAGGAGGSGIVIIRYQSNSISPAFKIVQQDANTVRLYNYSGSTQNLRLDVGTQAFQIRQVDTNTVRLYNYSGSTQNLRLDAIVGGVDSPSNGTVTLAPTSADVDSQSSTNSIWINKTGLDGSLLKLQKSGTDILNISQAGGNAALVLDQRLGGDIFTASASGTNRFVITNAGNVGIGTTTPSSKLHAVTDDATTNAITDIVTIDHTTSGTAANSIGTGILFRSEDSGGTTQNAGRMSAIIAANDTDNRDNVQTALTWDTRGITYGTDLGTFSTTSQGQLPGTRYSTGSVVASIGGTQYIYVTGGWTGSNTSTVYRSTLDSSGNAGTFATTSQAQLPQNNYAHSAITTSISGTQYLYLIAGNNTTSRLSTVYKATIDSSGNVGTFATTSQGQLPQIMYMAMTLNATIGGTQYIYVIGGDTGSNLSTVYKATIDASANIGSFATTSQGQLPQVIAEAGSVTSSIGGTQYIYILGGYTGAAPISTVYKATIDSSGNVGTFATTGQGQLPKNLRYMNNSTIISSIGGTQYIYVIGGYDGSVWQSTVYKATIDSSGNVGTFATTTQSQFPQTIAVSSNLITSIGGTQYIYTIDGYNGSTYSTVYKATIGPDTGSSTLTRRMKLDHAGNLTISGTIAQSGSPDIAENVRVSDSSIEGGDVVMIDMDSRLRGNDIGGGDDIYNRFVAKKADVPYSKQLLGVISSDPGIVLNASKNVVNDDKRSQENERPLAIAGRVPVKIDPDSDPIEAGDALTSSDKPGLAKKATKSGFVIAKSLESWTPCNTPSPLQGEGQGEVPGCGRDRILAFIQYGYVSQELVLDKNQNLDVQFSITPLPVASDSASPDTRYLLLNALGETLNQVGVFSDAAIANMKAGLVAADKITTKTLTVEDLLISPIADIDLLRVKNLIAENATVSGTLIAERLVSPTLDQINDQLSLVTSQYASASSILSAIQAKYTTFGAVTSATTSGDPLDTTHLFQENATIADLNVTGSLFANVLNSNDCDNNSPLPPLNLRGGGSYPIGGVTCDPTLYIQPLASAPINLLAGLMSLTPDGNVTINGNLNVTGSVLARDITSGKSNVDQLSANKLSLNDLTITTASATESASVGFSTIASSSAEIFVPNSKVSENTLIYVTPIGNTNNQVLYVKSKELCMPNDAQQMTTNDGVCLKGFTVAVPSTPSSDLRFNYWLIKTQ